MNRHIGIYNDMSSDVIRSSEPYSGIKCRCSRLVETGVAGRTARPVLLRLLLHNISEDDKIAVIKLIPSFYIIP
jgi:hypothetical protein